MTLEPNQPMRQYNGGSRPVPDPTALTDQAIARLEKSMTSWVEGQLAIRDERLSGIDEATKLRLAGVEAIPVQIDEKVGRLRDVHDERFKSIEKQFQERDTRQERESRDNKVAVDAAFAAQKEAAAKQDEGNAKAIDKSEVGTKELLRTLAERIDELKSRLDRGEGSTGGARQATGDLRQQGIDSRSLAFALLGAAGLIAGVVISLLK